MYYFIKLARVPEKPQNLYSRVTWCLIRGTVPFFSSVMFLSSVCPRIPFCPVFIQSDGPFYCRNLFFFLQLIVFLSLEFTLTQSPFAIISPPSMVLNVCIPTQFLYHLVQHRQSFGGSAKMYGLPCFQFQRLRSLYILGCVGESNN